MLDDADPVPSEACLDAGIDVKSGVVCIDDSMLVDAPLRMSETIALTDSLLELSPTGQSLPLVVDETGAQTASGDSSSNMFNNANAAPSASGVGVKLVNPKSPLPGDAQVDSDTSSVVHCDGVLSDRITDLTKQLEHLRSEAIYKSDLQDILQTCRSLITEASCTTSARMDQLATELIDKQEVLLQHVGSHSRSACIDTLPDDSTTVELSALKGELQSLATIVRTMQDCQTRDDELHNDHTDKHALQMRHDINEIRGKLQFHEEQIISMHEFQVNVIDPMNQSSHDDVNSSHVQPKTVSNHAAPCKHFRRGNCKFGHLCKFSHASNTNKLDSNSSDVHESDTLVFEQNNDITFWNLMEDSFCTCPKRQWCAFEPDNTTHDLLACMSPQSNIDEETFDQFLDALGL